MTVPKSDRKKGFCVCSFEPIKEIFSQQQTCPCPCPCLSLSRSHPPLMVGVAFLSLSYCGLALFSQSPTTMSLSSSSSSTTRPLRNLSETLDTRRWGTADITQRATAMKERTTALTPLTDAELDDIIFSIQNLVTADDDHTDFGGLRRVLQETAHLSHKDWSVTEANGQRLARVLFPPEPADGDERTTVMNRALLDRILKEGHWDDAVAHATTKKDSQQPWAVLVTGVNGIRKTTSLYQDWWPQLLREALVAPPSADDDETEQSPPTLDTLPSGRNSFFRQLDHMIATLCNEDFCILYQLTSDLIDKEGASMDEAIAKYADLKAAIFGRYRTLSELLGAALLQKAKEQGANCLMETSGRDVAMFHYVNHFFGNTSYNKLALHFTINDLSHARTSVDARMRGELLTGLQALQQEDARAVVYANAGGPYGSTVLAGVQEASDRVWNTDIQPADSVVAADWYKATIQITAHEAPRHWTARAVRPDGSLGTVFTFASRE